MLVFCGLMLLLGAGIDLKQGEDSCVRSYIRKWKLLCRVWGFRVQGFQNWGGTVVGSP